MKTPPPPDTNRVKNKKKVIVKFQDMDDGNNVYQAKFRQNEGAEVIIHANLTTDVPDISKCLQT